MSAEWGCGCACAQCTRQLAARAAFCEAMTPREREVLAQLLEGKSHKEIGRALGIAYGTVKVHLDHVRGVLGAKSQAHAISIFLRAGL